MHFIELGNDILDQVVYRGEGNASIVIAQKTKAKVIRLLKKDDKFLRSSQDHHVTQLPMRSIKFIHLIMKPLTDPFLSSATELAHVKSDLISKLSKIVEAHRPLHRLNKTLHLEDQYALVMDDLCTLPFRLTRQLHSDDLIGPTISVEIKPKQGSLPIHRSAMKSSINDQLIGKFKNCCLYGLNQHLKLSRGLINQTSGYCPINLFSGCPMRMKNALEELIQNPQNNLRIFKDRLLAFGESSKTKLSSIFEQFFDQVDEIPELIKPNQLKSYTIGNNEERLVDLLIQCLLNDHDDKDSETNVSNTDNENSYINGDTCLQHQPKGKCRRCDTNPSSKKLKCAATTTTTSNSNHKLPNSCVLSSVLRVQKLDTIGAHEAMNMLGWLLEHSGEETDIIISELSRPQFPIGFGSVHQLPNETKQQYYLRKVWEFLVSLTAKDCSIIVTLRRISEGHYESIVCNRPSVRSHLLKEQLSGNYYLFDVGIADLDQKLPSKISRIRDKLNLIQRMMDLSKLDTITSQALKSGLYGQSNKTS